MEQSNKVRETETRDTEREMRGGANAAIVSACRRRGTIGYGTIIQHTPGVLANGRSGERLTTRHLGCHASLHYVRRCNQLSEPSTSIDYYCVAIEDATDEARA